MPTPFMHLHFAEMLRSRLNQTDKPNGRLLQQQIAAHWPAFYLGNVAPDCSAIAPISRQATHFHGVPMQPDDDPVRAFVNALPDLATAPAARRMFVAGYIAHLFYDYVWYWQVLVPWFFQQDWDERPSRRLVHFALLTHIDDTSWRRLPPQPDATLLAAMPDHWLPFVSDDVLAEWRDLVGHQLAPEADKQTAVIYAHRLKIPPETFSSYVADAAWMAQNVFHYVPLDQIQPVIAQAIDCCTERLLDQFFPSKRLKN